MSDMVPSEFHLSRNYPNPFNPTAVISWQLPVTSDVRLVVYDLLGREVAVLLDERKCLGSNEMGFGGSTLDSGVYIYRLTAGEYVESKKMFLLKRR